MGVLDYLCGTDTQFYSRKESTRHKTFYSMVPIKQQDTGKPKQPASVLSLFF